MSFAFRIDSPVSFYKTRFVYNYILFTTFISVLLIALMIISSRVSIKLSRTILVNNAIKAILFFFCFHEKVSWPFDESKLNRSFLVDLALNYVCFVLMNSDLIVPCIEDHLKNSSFGLLKKILCFFLLICVPSGIGVFGLHLVYQYEDHHWAVSLGFIVSSFFYMKIMKLIKSLI